MHRLNQLGKKFNGTGSYEFPNYDQPSRDLLVYTYNVAFVKDQVYTAILAASDIHGFRKDSVISFLYNFKKMGVTPGETFTHSPYLPSLFDDFIEELIDELRIGQLGGQPF